MRLLIATLVSLFVTSSVWAAKVLTVKNGKALIDLEGEAWTSGDRIAVRDGDGKARGLLEITQTRNGRAIANIVRGTIPENSSLSKLGATAKTPEKKAKPSRRAKQSDGKAGFLAGYSMTSMTVKPSSATSISLSGSSFNLSGLYQMTLDGGFSARMIGGYETLNASGDSPTGCVGSTSCKVEISYLGLEVLGQYTFYKRDSVEIWAGAGLGFLFALNKSSNVLDTSKITTNQTIVAALGFDYRLSAQSFVPVQLDYAMFPDNSTSTASQIILRAGYGWDF